MIIGIDEVGRGPGAGPVVLCGFYLHNEKVRGEILAHFPKRMLKDSKKLTEKWRDSLASLFHTQKESGDVSFILAERSAHDIDNRGISICIKECVAEILKTACADSKVTAQEIRVLLDGSLYAPQEYTKQETIIKGDEKVLEIACASIVAKVSRDAYMKKIAKTHQVYAFEKNMGYLTKEHIKLLHLHGASPLHRISFLKNILINKENFK